MADIKLFNIHGTVQELPSQQVALEKELQNLLEKNMQTFFGVTFLKSEYKITNGRMDSIGIDENNCPVIFEYTTALSFLNTKEALTKMLSIKDCFILIGSLIIKRISNYL